jgi:hypothetical protein
MNKKAAPARALQTCHRVMTMSAIMECRSLLPALAEIRRVAMQPGLPSPNALALQLLLWEMSESMGNHDSEVVDASSVD